jgi:hypothetical protein
MLKGFFAERRAARAEASHLAAAPSRTAPPISAKWYAGFTPPAMLRRPDLSTPVLSVAMPSLNANGIRIAFDTAATRSPRPLLLMHGLGLQLTAWPDEFVDGLVELGFLRDPFDNRDCGLSTKFDRPASRAWAWPG